MTINKVIATVDALKPNVFTDEDKARWIIEVDGKVNAELVKSSTYAAPEHPADGDKTLLVPAPYDSVYEKFVYAEIALKNLDYNEYNALAVDFNDSFAEYAAYYRRTNQPPTATYIKNLW